MLCVSVESNMQSFQLCSVPMIIPQTGICLLTLQFNACCESCNSEQDQTGTFSRVMVADSQNSAEETQVMDLI